MFGKNKTIAFLWRNTGFVHGLHTTAVVCMDAHQNAKCWHGVLYRKHRRAATYQRAVEPLRRHRVTRSRFPPENTVSRCDSLAAATSLHQPDVAVKQPAALTVKENTHGHVGNLDSTATGTRKRRLFYNIGRGNTESCLLYWGQFGIFE